MNQYDTLYKLRILHPYFDDGKCPVIHIRPEKETLCLIANYRYIFKQTAANEWHIIGETPVAAGDWLHNNHAIYLTATINDPDFLWYSNSLLPSDIQGENICCLPGKDSLKTFEIRLDAETLPPSTPDHARIYTLSYHERSLYWEYILIPRNRPDEELTLFLTEATGKITFDEPVPTQWNNTRAYQTRSTSPVPLRARYPFQLQLYEKKRFGSGGSDLMRRMLCKRVAPPTPGQFLPRTPETIQHILYF